MSIVYGLTSVGFNPKTLDIIVSDITNTLQLAFGPSVDLSANSILGQLVQITAEEIALAWESVEAVYVSQDPDAATGASLDALAALTGTIRPAATFSSVTLTLAGTPATAIASSTQVAAASTGTVFATVAGTTLGLLQSWAGSHAYAVGDRVTNGGKCYQCTVTGTSAASGGPTGTGSAIVDGLGTLVWEYIGTGTAAVDVVANATLTGPLFGAALDVTVIQTAITGLNTAVNLADASPGSDVDTDGELRGLRVAELALAGTSPPDAIRADLLGVDGVTSVTVYYNPSDSQDVNGLSPHSVEALVLGGTDQAVGNQIFASVAAGIATVGNTGVTVIDSSGTSQPIRFSRPVAVPIFITITVKYDATAYPADGDAEIKAAIVTYGDTLAIGRDAVATQLGAQAFTVAGVLDIPRSGSEGGTLIGIVSSPSTDTTVSISPFQIATYSTLNIVVVSSPGTV